MTKYTIGASGLEYHQAAANALYDEQPSDRMVTLHRPPTAGEIRFGYGATHYRDFPERVLRRKDGKLKRWIKAYDDGLRYYR